MHLRTAVLHSPLARGSSDTVSFGSGLGQVTWTPFKVKDPENKQALPASLAQEGRPGVLQLA